MPTREKVRSLLKSLRASYRWRERAREPDPVERGVTALLARASSTPTARRVLRRLFAQFVDWNDIRVARPVELEPAIEAERSPEVRERLRAALEHVQRFLSALARTRRGVELRSLAGATLTEVRRFLGSLDVLEKEQVPVFAMLLGRGEKLALDEDTARVLRRLGLVPRAATRSRTESLLGRATDPAAYRTLYLLLKEHAVERCRKDAPLCKGCRLHQRCRSRGKF